METEKSKAEVVRELIETAVMGKPAIYPGQATKGLVGYVRGLVGQHNVFNKTNLAVKHDKENGNVIVFVKPQKRKELMDNPDFKIAYRIANDAYNKMPSNANDMKYAFSVFQRYCGFDDDLM
jgi:hypothetical protein